MVTVRGNYKKEVTQLRKYIKNRWWGKSVGAEGVRAHKEKERQEEETSLRWNGKAWQSSENSCLPVCVWAALLSNHSTYRLHELAWVSLWSLQVKIPILKSILLLGSNRTIRSTLLWRGSTKDKANVCSAKNANRYAIDIEYISLLDKFWLTNAFTKEWVFLLCFLLFLPLWNRLLMLMSYHIVNSAHKKNFYHNNFYWSINIKLSVLIMNEYLEELSTQLHHYTLVAPHFPPCSGKVLHLLQSRCW